MPFDGDHIDAPLPGLDHPLFAPHDAVELVDGAINDGLEFSALYSVADHDFVTGKQPTYYQGHAIKLGRSVQMAGRANLHVGDATYFGGANTALFYPAPAALTGIGTRDFSVLAVYQSDSAGDIGSGINTVTSLACAGGTATNRAMAALYHNTWSTSDRSLQFDLWDTAANAYGIASSGGLVVHKTTTCALFTRVKGALSLWYNGRRVATGTCTASLSGTGNLCVGAYNVQDTRSPPWYGLTGFVHLVSWWSRGMVEAEAVERTTSPFSQYRAAPWMVGWRKAAGGDLILDAPSVALVLAALAPTVATGASASLPLPTLAALAQAPTVATGASSDLPLPTLAATPQAPSVATGSTLEPPAGAMSITAQAPTLGTGISLDLPAGSAGFTGYAPAVATGTALDLPLATFTASGQTPSVATGLALDLPAGTLVLTGQPPSTNVNSISLPLASMLVSAYTPGVEASLDGSVSSSAMFGTLRRLLRI